PCPVPVRLASRLNWPLMAAPLSWPAEIQAPPTAALAVEELKSSADVRLSEPALSAPPPCSRALDPSVSCAVNQAPSVSISRLSDIVVTDGLIPQLASIRRGPAAHTVLTSLSASATIPEQTA